MGKKLIHDNWHVIVTPKRIGDLVIASVPDSWWTEKEQEQHLQDSCKQFVQDIRRHVENVGSVYIDHDIHEVCEFCGSNWADYPECCQKALEEFEQEKNNQ